MSLGSESNRVKQPYEGGLSIVPTSVSTSFTAAESLGGQYWKASPKNARLQSSFIIFEQDDTCVNVIRYVTAYFTPRFTAWLHPIQQPAIPFAAADWFSNIDNPRTRRAYQTDLEDFCSFVGLATADEFRMVTRSHVLAWRAQLEKRGLAGSTIRRKLSALASLFDHLLKSNAVAGGNPSTGSSGP